jgi:hypothetical protein
MESGEVADKSDSFLEPMARTGLQRGDRETKGGKPYALDTFLETVRADRHGIYDIGHASSANSRLRMQVGKEDGFSMNMLNNLKDEKGL